MECQVWILKKGLEVKVKLHNQSSHVISMLSFILAFKMEYDRNGVHEVAAVWLFHFSFKKSAGAWLKACPCLSSSGWLFQEALLVSFGQSLNYLWEHTNRRHFWWGRLAHQQPEEGGQSECSWIFAGSLNDDSTLLDSLWWVCSQRKAYWRSKPVISSTR